MTTINPDLNGKACRAIDAAIARAQRAAKASLSAAEVRSIELTTMRELARADLAAKNAAVLRAAQQKADSERLARLRQRAAYERAQMVRDIVTVEYAAIFSTVTCGADSQAYCRQVSQASSQTVTVCDNKIGDFLREVFANTVPAKSVPAKSVPAKSVPAKSVPAKSVPAKSKAKKLVADEIAALQLALTEVTERAMLYHSTFGSSDALTVAAWRERDTCAEKLAAWKNVATWHGNKIWEAVRNNTLPKAI